ncbi:MAG: hypothetical protein N2423_06295 [Novosphingobium sp.]|nr:hypothetical protein [Novosphingobium sp.]
MACSIMALASRRNDRHITILAITIPCMQMAVVACLAQLDAREVSADAPLRQLVQSVRKHARSVIAVARQPQEDVRQVCAGLVFVHGMAALVTIMPGFR